jgi:PAS domain S-box-containing protein
MMRENPEIVQQLRLEEQQGLIQRPKKIKNNSGENKTTFDPLEHQSTNQMLRTLIETAEKSNAAILLTDNNGIIQYINETFMEMTGYSFNELSGKNIRSLQSTNQPKSFFKHLITTISTGTIWAGELESTRKNNETYWEHTTIIPITDQLGKITHYLSIKKEITQQKQLERSLRIKENAILSSINAIVLTDLSGKIIYVNPSFLNMWSFDSEKKVMGKSVFCLWHKGGQYANIMDKVILQGGWLGEIIARSHNGRLFPVQMSASIVKDEHNKSLSIMASFVDITKQKRMEKNYKKFKKISDEADYGSVIYDLTGTILYGNNSFAQMHGYQINELIGKQLSILYSSDRYENVEKLLNDLKKHGKIVGKEQVHIHKNGTVLPLLVTSTLIDDEQFHRPFVAGTMIDISQMKQAEQKIIRQAEEVKLMNQELQTAREQLTTLNKNLELKVLKRTREIQKLIEQKDIFINQLGHDLRTPLTPMFALLPLLEKKVNDEKGKTYIQMIQRNIRFMKDLVNKTITYAKLHSNKITFNFTEVNLKDFIDEIYDDLFVFLKENNGILINNVEKNCVIEADDLQLKEVFQNLFSNAIKYKKKDKPVHIEITSKSEKKNRITIFFSDDGIGMAKDQVEQVFEEFYKADDARTDVDSHGLGLNICKRIIEKHDGTIGAESKGIGKGSTFYFTIPKEQKISD